MRKHRFLVAYSFKNKTMNGYGNFDYSCGEFEYNGMIGQASMRYLTGLAEEMVRKNQSIIPDDCFILSISYLGYMNDDEWMSE